jgi:hypothetical protein
MAEQNLLNMEAVKEPKEEIVERINNQNIPPNSIGQRELDSAFLADYLTETSTNTVSNKTFTSPIISNSTSTGADSGVETLTNKTIVATSNTISAIDKTMMTDRTRSVWLPAASFAISEGAPTLASGAIDTPTSWLLDAAAIESVLTDFIMPEDYASGNITVKSYFSMVSATSGNVVIHIRFLSVADGADASASGTSQEDTVSVPGTAGLLKIYTQSVTFATGGAGELLRACIRRIGSSGSDTATGDMRMIGIKLEYTADM